MRSSREESVDGLRADRRAESAERISTDRLVGSARRRGQESARVQTGLLFVKTQSRCFRTSVSRSGRSADTGGVRSGDPVARAGDPIRHYSHWSIVLFSGRCRWLSRSGSSCSPTLEPSAADSPRRHRRTADCGGESHPRCRRCIRRRKQLLVLPVMRSTTACAAAHDRWRMRH